jgi:hypothetical protein
METRQIIIIVLSFFLGMLILNIVKNVCKCELKEGLCCEPVAQVGGQGPADPGDSEDPEDSDQVYNCTLNMSNVHQSTDRGRNLANSQCNNLKNSQECTRANPDYSTGLYVVNDVGTWNALKSQDPLSPIILFNTDSTEQGSDVSFCQWSADTSTE